MSVFMYSSFFCLSVCLSGVGVRSVSRNKTMAMTRVKDERRDDEEEDEEEEDERRDDEEDKEEEEASHARTRKRRFSSGE
jgi:hypothetical protein